MIQQFVNERFAFQGSDQYYSKVMISFKYFLDFLWINSQHIEQN